MENKVLETLAKQLNLTAPDEEKEAYILKPDEEDYIIANEILSQKRHMAWKMKGLAYSDEETLARIGEINWEEEINREEILQRANSSKHYDNWQKQKRENEKNDRIEKHKEIALRCNAKYIYNLMAWTSKNRYDKQLVVHDDNRQLIKTICFYLSHDERFEKELGLSFKKGLLIRGISGLGKTHLVKCVENNEVNPIYIISMLEIADEIKTEGEYEIRPGDRNIIYIDDVGTEEATVNHYGTKINWFKNYIERVYLKSRTFYNLMISTNNNFAEIEAKYGFRVRSRVKDMFNIIDISGKDMRG